MKHIQIKNVRLSFPSLFQRATYDGKEGKYQATFLFDKKEHKKEIEALFAEIDSILADNKVKISKDKYCIQDGENKEYEGYANCYSLKASSQKRPIIIDRDKSQLSVDDDKIYAGCYVNAVISFWIQNNQFGKRINATVHGVQFCKDGERFGAEQIDVDAFDDLTQEDSKSSSNKVNVDLEL
jgi:hypothetical protein